jgi:hypothetical protein
MPVTKQRLPHRALLWPHKAVRHYDLAELRKIANDHQINSRRKRFYRFCDHLAMQYYMDHMNEVDFYALSDVKATYRSALADGRRYAKSLGAIDALRSAYSWYREVNLENDDEIYTKELREWVIDANKSLEDVIKRLPEPPKVARRGWR